MIYAASLSHSKFMMPMDRSRQAQWPVHMQWTVKCSKLTKKTGRSFCVKSVYSATGDVTGRHHVGLAAKPLVSNTSKVAQLSQRDRTTP